MVETTTDTALKCSYCGVSEKPLEKLVRTNLWFCPDHAFEQIEVNRPSWDAYFTNIARAVAQRGSCLRAKVGAVIVSSDNRILATGYNGAPSGEPHCIDVGCLVVDGHCQRTQHAEVNAVAYAARYGVAIEGSRLYLWLSQGATVTSVCRECQKVLRAAGVSW